MPDGWVDDAGPVIRPYMLTGGRTAEDADEFDLVALIQATGAPQPGRLMLSPEHQRILRLCRSATPVADVAADMDLALGVVRVLLGDLLDAGLILVRRPAQVARFPNVSVLREMIDGLNAL
jgi:hypothetical protein